MEETSIFSVVLWCQSIAGWTSFDNTPESLFLGTNVADEIQEIWVPMKDAESRKSSIPTAVVNLASTSTCGCGILMVPFLFERCGIGVSSFLLICMAIISDQSQILLCRCARRAGVGTYGNLGQVAFSPWLEKALFALFHLFLLLVVSAHYACVREILDILFRYSNGFDENILVLAPLIMLTTPLIIQRELHRIRFANMVSLFGVLVLAATVYWMASVDTPGHDVSKQDELSTSVAGTFSDISFGLPIVVMGFFCSFNVLHVQSTLSSPSVDRINMVVHVSTLVSLAVMFVVGTAGYHFLKTSSLEDIGDEHRPLERLFGSSQYSPSVNWASICGLVGCGIAILLNTATILLPCRDCILEVVERLVQEHEDHCQRVRQSWPDECCEDEDIDEETCMTFPSLPSVPSRWSDQSEGDMYVVHEGTRLLPRIIEERAPRCKVTGNPVIHYASTLCIVVTGVLLSLLFSDVLLLWRYMGSTAGILLSFLLPASCYLKVQERLPSVSVDGWGLVSWAFVAMSIPSVVICARQLIF